MKMLDRILHKASYGGLAGNRGADAGGFGLILLTYARRQEGEVEMNGKKLGFTLLLVSMLAFSPAAQADQSAEEAAVAASQAWLSLVDGGNYSGSWEEAAEYFRTAVTVEQWQRSMRAFREPLGGVLSRKLKFKQYTNSLPGAPDGEYVVVQYETSFENKKSAIETITPMLDKDGTWRVSGYYIK
jgi:hypothetical protein